MGGKIKYVIKQKYKTQARMGKTAFQFFLASVHLLGFGIEIAIAYSEGHF